MLGAVVAGGTSVLLGQSGAGKSTLANALLGEDVMDVRAARDVDGKGRHTTTTRNLLVLPGGGVLIDTPGLRGVGLWDAEAGVGQVFSEIEELAAAVPLPRLRPRAPSRAARCSAPSRTARCRSGGWTATASCCARTSASSPRRTPGCGPRSARVEAQGRGGQGGHGDEAGQACASGSGRGRPGRLAPAPRPQPQITAPSHAPTTSRQQNSSTSTEYPVARITDRSEVQPAARLPRRSRSAP